MVGSFSRSSSWAWHEGCRQHSKSGSSFFLALVLISNDSCGYVFPPSQLDDVFIITLESQFLFSWMLCSLTYSHSDGITHCPCRSGFLVLHSLATIRPFCCPHVSPSCNTASFFIMRLICHADSQMNHCLHSYVNDCFVLKLRTFLFSNEADNPSHGQYCAFTTTLQNERCFSVHLRSCWQHL